MHFDPNNPVVALCAAGMLVDGTPDEARALFEQAWAARRDAYDAAIAAHYLARHQATPSAVLEWNARAVACAVAVPGDHARELFPSLYLNLAIALWTSGDAAGAREAANRAAVHLDSLTDDGYRAFVARGIARLQASLGARLQPSAHDAVRRNSRSRQSSRECLLIHYGRERSRITECSGKSRTCCGGRSWARWIVGPIHR